MKRVLVTGASNIGKAGVATIVYNWGQNLDQKSVVYDYLAQHGNLDSYFENKIKEKGGILYVPEKQPGGRIKKHFSNMLWIKKILIDGKYEIFHINADSAYLAAWYILIAKRAKVKHIIVHSHSTMIDDNRELTRGIKKVLHVLLRPYVIKNGEKKLACSKEAARWMFRTEEKSTIIPNGIDIERFVRNDKVRETIRKQENCDDKWIMGTVGRLSYQKNVLFNVRIFEKILEKKPNAILWLVGDGPLREEVEKYIKDRNLSEHCKVWGSRNDVNELLSAMDVFVLPSLFEGLGIVYIEAQAAGLPTFASDAVPEEAFVTQLIKRIPLSASEQDWAEKILNTCSDTMVDVGNEIDTKGYSINASSKLLQQIYEAI